MSDAATKRITAIIRATRESLAYAAPEMQDLHWHRLTESIVGEMESPAWDHVSLDAAKEDYRWPWVRGVEHVVQEGTSFWRRLREAAGYSREDIWYLTGAIVDPAELGMVEGDYSLGGVFTFDQLLAFATVYARSPGELLDASFDEKGCEMLAEQMEDEPDEPLPPAVKLVYRNHRGEISERTVTPMRVRFGSTEHHPEPQFLLEVFDHDKRAQRTFALKDCDFMTLDVTA